MLNLVTKNQRMELTVLEGPILKGRNVTENESASWIKTIVVLVH